MLPLNSWKDLGSGVPSLICFPFQMNARSWRSRLPSSVSLKCVPPAVRDWLESSSVKVSSASYKGNTYFVPCSCVFVQQEKGVCCSEATDHTIF